MGASRYIRCLSYGIVLVVLWGAPGHARHDALPNLIPETADNGTLEPCILEGACAGRQPSVAPAVVEGTPPVPMHVANSVIPLTRTTDTTPPTAAPYPRAEATDVYEDVVVKVFFSEPVTGVDVTTVTLTDAQGTFTLEQVPPGHYELICWLPSWEVHRRERDPETGQTTRISFAPPVEKARKVTIGPRERAEVQVSLRAQDFHR